MTRRVPKFLYPAANGEMKTSTLTTFETESPLFTAVTPRFGQRRASHSTCLLADVVRIELNINPVPTAIRGVNNPTGPENIQDHVGSREVLGKGDRKIGPPIPGLVQV